MSDSVVTHSLDPKRYERTSELIKAFKQSCSRLREEFHSLEMELAEFTAVLDEMTKNTYVLVVVHNPVVGKEEFERIFRSAKLPTQKPQQSRSTFGWQGRSSKSSKEIH